MSALGDTMAKDSVTGSGVWLRFERAARQRRGNPMRLLAEFMSDCLERWEDERLDAEIQEDTRSSGYRERDAVEIVRRYRGEKRARRAAS
jgi:hypothetical protein